MKKLFILVCLLLTVGIQGQVPTKLFDVRNGNGLVEGGITYARATYIPYKDNASKDAIIDAFCGAYGYTATVLNPDLAVGGTIPNPISKQQFFNNILKDFIKGVYKHRKEVVAATGAQVTAAAAADAELP